MVARGGLLVLAAGDETAVRAGVKPGRKTWVQPLCQGSNIDALKEVPSTEELQGEEHDVRVAPRLLNHLEQLKAGKKDRGLDQGKRKQGLM